MNAIKSVWHGVDTAKVGYLVHWPRTFVQTLAEFADKRAQAQSLKDPEEFIPIKLGTSERPFIVRPVGARMLPFGFEAAGIVVLIGNTLEPWKHADALTPNVRVEMQPFSVARLGLAEVHRIAVELLLGMGGNIEGNMLSEVHMTCDLETDRPHVPSDYHVSLDKLWSKVRTRLRSNGESHEVESSDMGMESSGQRLKLVHIGKDKKMLRVYDKILELRTHPDKDFEAQLWNSPQHCLAIHNPHLEPKPTAIMRVEFQLRRERLIERMIFTVEHFLTLQEALWEHLSTEFVTMIENDDSNRSRCSVQQWWQVVQAAWKTGPVPPLPKRGKDIPSFKKYVDQSMGLLLAAGARLEGIEEFELPEILGVIRANWEDKHWESWQQILLKKRRKLEILRADLREQWESASVSEDLS